MEGGICLSGIIESSPGFYSSLMVTVATPECYETLRESLISGGWHVLRFPSDLFRALGLGAPSLRAQQGWALFLIFLGLPRDFSDTPARPTSVLLTRPARFPPTLA